MNSAQIDAKERKRYQNRLAQRTYRRNQKQRIRALEEVVRHLPVGLMSSSLITDSEVDIAAATATHSPPSNDPIWNYSDHDRESSSNTIQPITLPIMHTSIFKDQLAREKRDDLSMKTFVPDLKDDSFGSQSSLGRTALHRAVSNGNEPLSRLLLEQGADIRRVDDNGQTALHLAVRSGHHDLVKLLLETNVNANIKDCSGRTALFEAVQCEDERIAKLLLDASVDVNCKDALGDVALHWAVERGSKSLTLLLLSYGADINA